MTKKTKIQIRELFENNSIRLLQAFRDLEKEVFMNKKLKADIVKNNELIAVLIKEMLELRKEISKLNKKVGK